MNEPPAGDSQRHAGNGENQSLLHRPFLSPKLHGIDHLL
jgi:hypothetical protein